MAQLICYSSPARKPTSLGGADILRSSGTLRDSPVDTQITRVISAGDFGVPRSFHPGISKRRTPLKAGPLACATR